MNIRLYGLIEKHHRIDEALRSAQARGGSQWTQIARLTMLKCKVKQLIYRFERRSPGAKALPRSPMKGLAL